MGSPPRSAAADPLHGGFRLYTGRDAERVARMKRGLDEGLSAAEAARRALAPARPAQGLGLLDDAGRRLLSAVRGYDEAAAHAVLDEALAGVALETVLRGLITVIPAARLCVVPNAGHGALPVETILAFLRKEPDGRA